MDLSGGSIDKAREIIDETLAKTDILKRLKGRTFYAVGGTWRSLAKLHMAERDYPLRVMHGYAVPASPPKKSRYSAQRRAKATWWSDSNIRIPSRQALLRMLESKDH